MRQPVLSDEVGALDPLDRDELRWCARRSVRDVPDEDEEDSEDDVVKRLRFDHDRA